MYNSNVYAKYIVQLTTGMNCDTVCPAWLVARIGHPVGEVATINITSVERLD
jgi:hypothetical protein